MSYLRSSRARMFIAFSEQEATEALPGWKMKWCSDPLRWSAAVRRGIASSNARMKTIFCLNFAEQNAKSLCTWLEFRSRMTCWNDVFWVDSFTSHPDARTMRNSTRLRHRWKTIWRVNCSNAVRTIPRKHSTPDWIPIINRRHPWSVNRRWLLFLSFSVLVDRVLSATKHSSIHRCHPKSERRLETIDRHRRTFPSATVRSTAGDWCWENECGRRIPKQE